MKYLNLAISLSLLWGCSNPAKETSHISVTNGNPTKAFPEVQLVRRGDYICTGTFVGPNTLITAAHCVDRSSYNGGVTVMGVAPKKLFVGDYDRNYNFGVNYKDLAIVVFGKDIALGFKSVANTPPSKGDPLQIVGFGNNLNYEDSELSPIIDKCVQSDSRNLTLNELYKICNEKVDRGEGAGEKRFGTNFVASVKDMISFYGVTRNQITNSDNTTSPTGSSVSSGSGDSGGPMFVNDKLVGVTSGGGATSSHYTNLNSATSRALLKKAIAGGAYISGMMGSELDTTVTQDDYKTSVLFEDQINENGVLHQGFRLKLEPLTTEAAAIEGVTFDIHETFGKGAVCDSRKKTNEREACVKKIGNAYYSTKLYTSVKYWDTNGIQVELAGSRIIRIEGPRVDWRKIADQSQITENSFKVVPKYGDIVLVDGSPWIEFSLTLDAPREILDQVVSVKYMRHPTFGDKQEEVVVKNASNPTFKTSAVKTYGISWALGDTVITLKGTEGNRTLPPIQGVNIDWTSQLKSHLEREASKITNEDIKIHVSYGDLVNIDGSMQMPFAFGLEADKNTAALIESVTYGRHPTFGSLANETLVSNEANPNFKSQFTTTYANFWEASTTTIKLVGGRELTYNNITIDWRNKDASAESAELNIEYSSSNWTSSSVVKINGNKITTSYTTSEVIWDRSRPQVFGQLGQSTTEHCEGELPKTSMDELKTLVGSLDLENVSDFYGASVTGRKSSESVMKIGLGSLNKNISYAESPSSDDNRPASLRSFYERVAQNQKYATACRAVL